jgi:HK97 gp10 family phage protein
MGIQFRRGDSRGLENVVKLTEGTKVPRALVAAALVFEANTKELLSRPGAGAIRRSGQTRVGAGSFRRGKDGKLQLVRRGAARTKIDVTDRASRPGDPPAPDTGTLRNSIAHEVVSSQRVRVGTNVEYAPFLEFGTARMAPRPFMRPALAMSRQQMADAIVAELRGGE